MTIEMWLVLVLLAVPLALVMRSRWRIDVAALFLMVSLGLAQYLGFSILGNAHTPEDAVLAVSGFSQPVVITLIGLFILTQALTHNGVMRWIGQRLATAGAASERRLILLFTLVSVLLSLIMNNIAVGALLLPSAMQVAQKAKVSPSKLLMPIAFGSALGGMATYFTTANIVLSNLLLIAKPPQQPLGILTFLPTGSLIVLAGLVYLTIAGNRLLPDRKPGIKQHKIRRASKEVESLYALEERLWKARLLPKSTLTGKTLKESRIGADLGLTIVAIVRDKQTIFVPQAEEKILPGDVFLLIGREGRVRKLEALGLNVGPKPHSISAYGMTLIELALAPHSAYVGKTIKEIDFRRKYGFTVVALSRRNRNYRTDVGNLPLELGDALLITGPAERLSELHHNPDIIVFETMPEVSTIPRTKAILSLLLFAGSIALSLVGLPAYLSVLTAALVALLLRLLPFQEMYRSIEWQVVFFIAGMYAASLAMLHTGLAALASQRALTALGDAGPLTLAAFVFLLSATLTQFMGSQATAFVVGPIAISAALHLHTNPQAIAVVSAIGCTASFLTPISHPVNLIVMSPGNYRPSDFLRVGAGLMLVTFAALMLGMVVFWKL